MKYFIWWTNCPRLQLGLDLSLQERYFLPVLKIVPEFQVYGNHDYSGGFYGPHLEIEGSLDSAQVAGEERFGKTHNRHSEKRKDFNQKILLVVRLRNYLTFSKTVVIEGPPSLMFHRSWVPG